MKLKNILKKGLMLNKIDELLVKDIVTTSFLYRNIRDLEGNTIFGENETFVSFLKKLNDFDPKKYLTQPICKELASYIMYEAEDANNVLKLLKDYDSSIKLLDFIEHNSKVEKAMYALSVEYFRRELLSLDLSKSNYIKIKNKGIGFLGQKDFLETLKLIIDESYVMFQPLEEDDFTKEKLVQVDSSVDIEKIFYDFISKVNDEALVKEALISSNKIYVYVTGLKHDIVANDFIFYLPYSDKLKKNLDQNYIEIKEYL